MANLLRRNAQGDVQLGSITPWSLQDLLALYSSGDIDLDTHFECPLCRGQGKVMTENSRIQLGNIIDDHGDDRGYKPHYQDCRPCKGSGRLSPGEINFLFDKNSFRSASGISLVLRGEDTE